MLTRPTLKELQQRALTDARSRVDGATPDLRRSLIGSVMTAVAAAQHGLYGWLIEFAKQCTPWSATQDSARLGWAGLWRMAPKPAIAASGTAMVTGDVGAAVPDDTRLQSVSGVEYQVVGDYVIGGDGTVLVDIEAVLPGKDGNQPAASPLSFISPLVGVAAVATIDADGLTGGVDVESATALQARLVARLSEPPQGGSTADYVRWAISVPGITRAWCFDVYRGPGSVRVYVVNDDYGGPELAGAAEVEAAFEYIDGIKPAGMVIQDPEGAPGDYINGLEVLTPIAAPLDLTIAGVSDADTRAKMTLAFENLIKRDAVPEGGIPLTRIIGVLSSAATGGAFDLDMPVSSPTAADGEILTPGDITWA